MSDEVVRRELSHALDMWARETRLTFTELAPDDTSADIQVGAHIELPRKSLSPLKVLNYKMQRSNNSFSPLVKCNAIRHASAIKGMPLLLLQTISMFRFELRRVNWG